MLLELAGFREGQEAALLARMSLPDKRVWLSRRLYRHHHGGRLSEEDPILFVEATRDEPARVLHQIRAQYDAGVGLGGDLSSTLEVNFKDENSAGSAVRREWFALVSEAFVAPSAGLLIGTERGASVRPLPMLATDPRLPQQLRDLEMLGRFLGLAIIQQVCVGVRLHPSLCRSLLAHGQRWEWTYEDVEQLDAQLYQHKVKYVLENDVEPLCLDFTDVLHDAPPEVAPPETALDQRLSQGSAGAGEVAGARAPPDSWAADARGAVAGGAVAGGADGTGDGAGDGARHGAGDGARHGDGAGRGSSEGSSSSAGSSRGTVPSRVELVPGGEALEVTEANKAEWVRLVCEWRLFGSIEAQVGAMVRGFEAAVPRTILSQLAQLIEPPDLARMLAGEAEIDLADWEKHSACTGGLRRTHKVFRWFWRALRSFSPTEREQLLMFVTGSRRPPVGGFAQLQGFNGGVHLFTLCATTEPKDSLPRAHACICTIDLPEYSSYAALRRAVHIALSLGSIGFDDAAVHDPADADAEDAADAPGGAPSTGSRRDAGPRVPT